MTATSKRPFRWLLLISLGLNVALIATLIMVAVDRYQPDRHRHGGRMNLPSPRLLMAALSTERQALLEDLYAEHRQSVRAAMRERRQARREVRKLMLASEFEPERIDLAFAELREADEKAAAAVQAMLMELLSQLTPEERAKVAELVPQRHRHRHDRDGDRDGSTQRQREVPAAAAEAEAAAEEAEK